MAQAGADRYARQTMARTTLVDIRRHVERLASDDGGYIVRCARTGDRPVPVSGLRFDARASARNAARAAEQYRAVLRRYDPAVTHHDLVICQDTTQMGSEAEHAAFMIANDRDATTEPRGPAAEGDPECRARVEFCHSVAAAVFQTLSASGHDAVEAAVIDAYFDLAETVADPDDLCRRLLERVAVALADQLSPAEQATVLADAADRLSPAETSERPMSAALSALEERGLLGDYVQSPWAVALEEGTRSVVVQLSEYALAPRDGRLPVLPIALELYRQRPEWAPSSFRAGELEDGWQLTLVLEREGEPDGLATAAIDA